MLSDELRARAAAGRPIRVAASGAGWMGSGFAAQMSHVTGMELSVLVDPNVGAAREAFRAAGIADERIVEAATSGAAADALARGLRVVSGDMAVAAALEGIDVLTDVTPSPASGAATAALGIDHGKDVVLINIEADVTVGRILKQRAAAAGVLYSVSSGDEPGCLMELFDFVTTLGFEPIVIGKGKNNPLNPAATPDTVAESARRSDKDPYQVASYVDGSKTMFEMTCAANATGCVPIRRGMIGPEATQETITALFSLVEDGGLAPHPGVIDFVQGSAMAGGVFVTVRVADPRVAADLQYLKVGQGQYATFFRPYHLWFIEAPISIARAVLHRERTLVPLDRPVADILTIAKRDLQPGERLDDFGGYTFRGLMDRADVVRAENGLPAGLAPGAQVIRPMSVGTVITWDDVRLDETSPVVRLRREQDQLATSVPSPPGGRGPE